MPVPRIPILEGATRLLGLLALGVSLCAQDYKAGPGSAPPAQLAAEVRPLLQSRGTKVVDPNGFLFCEVWLRTEPVSEATSLPAAVQAGTVPSGAFIGAIRYASPGADRFGRGFGPGLYTLRHAQGDTVLMLRSEDDPGPEPAPVEQLEESSRKVTRSDAPARLRLSAGASGSSPRLRITREGEWILQVVVSEAPVALLIVGVAR
jgi:hypothetical protein